MTWAYLVEILGDFFSQTMVLIVLAITLYCYFFALKPAYKKAIRWSFYLSLGLGTTYLIYYHFFSHYDLVVRYLNNNPNYWIWTLNILKRLWLLSSFFFTIFNIIILVIYFNFGRKAPKYDVLNDPWNPSNNPLPEITQLKWILTCDLMNEDIENLKELLEHEISKQHKARKDMRGFIEKWNTVADLSDTEFNEQYNGRGARRHVYSRTDIAEIKNIYLNKIEILDHNINRANERMTEIITFLPKQKGMSKLSELADFEGVNVTIMEDINNKTKGVLLGHYEDDNKKKVISYNNDSHILTIAQSGAGKNTSLIMPNLLINAFQGSKIILDLKGENAAVCSHWKGKKGIGKTYRLNPWNIFDMGSIKFNPFCLLDPYSEHLYDDCSAFAEAIINERANQSDAGDHFDEMAREFIATFLMYLVISNAPEEGKPTKTITPVDLYDELIVQTSSPENITSMIEKMLAINHPDFHVKRALKLGAHTISGVSSGRDNNEFRGIKTTVSKALKSFKSKALAQSVTATKEESIELIDDLFKSNQGNNDLYISFPQSEMKQARVWLRLVLTTFIRDNIKNAPKRPVLFILDEFPQLGTFNLIKNASSFLRGFHVRFWFIAQNISQFETNYGKDGMQTIFENCTVKQFFNVSDATARYVSQKMGKQSTVIKDLGTMEFKNMHSEEVMSQTEIEQTDLVINFIGNIPTILSTKAPYYSLDIFKNNAMPNPLFHGIEEYKKAIIQGKG